MFIDAAFQEWSNVSTTLTFQEWLENFLAERGLKLEDFYYNPFNPIIDLFPVNIPFLGVGKEFGEVNLADALIFMGLLAIGGEALGKIVPL